MIVQDIYLKDPGWCIRIYYGADKMRAMEIIDDLISIGCSGEHLKKAKEGLWRDAYNDGITYANPGECQAMIVIGNTTSAAEFANSQLHEQLHLLSYIAESQRIDPYGERICYIAGDLNMQMFKCAKNFLCDCCREKTYRKKWMVN